LLSYRERVLQCILAAVFKILVILGICSQILEDRRRRGFRNPKTFFERLPYDADDSGVSESSGNQSVSKTCAADLLSESQQIRFAGQKKLLREEEASAKQKTRKVVPAAAAAAAASACVGFLGSSSWS
jgi:HJR/Mrr/RecB family endonuclease